MKHLILPFLLCFLICLSPIDSDGQVLNKLRKAKDALKGMMDEEEDEEDNSSARSADSNSNDSRSSSGSKKTLNTRMSPEEVLQTLDAASSAYDNAEYSSARYSIQQALVEIEIQMGEDVLKEMPTEVKGQSYDPDDDKVISTGVGFVGLQIMRRYPGDNGDITASISNNAAMLAPYTMALSNPTMVSNSENMKAVTVNGKRGILELDENDDSFKLVLPFGQSSAFLLECESCQNESEVLNVADDYDLDTYLDIMGESPVTADSE